MHRQYGATHDGSIDPRRVDWNTDGQCWQNVVGDTKGHGEMTDVAETHGHNYC